MLSDMKTMGRFSLPERWFLSLYYWNDASSARGLGWVLLSKLSLLADLDQETIAVMVIILVPLFPNGCYSVVSCFLIFSED